VVFSPREESVLKIQIWPANWQVRTRHNSSRSMAAAQNPGSAPAPLSRALSLGLSLCDCLSAFSVVGMCVCHARWNAIKKETLE